MKTVRTLLLLPLALFGTGLAQTSGNPPATQNKQGWKLVWNDEFEKNGAPDPKKWTYEEGFVRNKEDQYYTKNRRQNARVEKGCLIIEARKESFNNPKYDPKATPEQWQKSRKQAQYTSAALTTEGLAQMKYGKIEVRAKLPKGIGSWPAIWMLGTSRPKVGWPACGEIDIMEYVSSAPGICHATLHWKRTDGGKGRKNASKGIKTKEPSLTDTFHVYGMEWDDKNITFTLDGKPYGTLPVDIANQPDGSNPFRAPHYLLLNLALGGSWGGKVEGNDFPRQYLIDYVRIYERNH